MTQCICVPCRRYVCHDSFWCALTVWYAWHGAFVCEIVRNVLFLNPYHALNARANCTTHVYTHKCVTCRVRIRDTADSSVSRDSFMCVSWLNCEFYDTTQTYVWRDSYVWRNWELCDLTGLCVWRVSFPCVTRHVYICQRLQHTATHCNAPPHNTTHICVDNDFTWSNL